MLPTNLNDVTKGAIAVAVDRGWMLDRGDSLLNRGGPGSGQEPVALRLDRLITTFLTGLFGCVGVASIRLTAASWAGLSFAGIGFAMTDQADIWYGGVGQATPRSTSTGMMARPISLDRRCLGSSLNWRRGGTG